MRTQKTLSSKSDVEENYGKHTGIILRISSAPTIFARFGPQSHLPVRRSLQNVGKKDTCVERRMIGETESYCATRDKAK